MEIRAENAVEDRNRKWFWMFLAVLMGMQFYFVEELVAAFALMTVALGVVGVVAAIGYGFWKTSELAVVKLTALSQNAAGLVMGTSRKQLT
jgi:hypothetical protein